MKYVNMINEKVAVENEKASKGFSKGERREDYADSWKGTGNVVLVGLPGSGKAKLASLLAERTGQEVISPVDAVEAVAALGREKTIVVLADELVEDDSVQPQIHGAGKVFYLMADSNTLRHAWQNGMEVTARVSGVKCRRGWRSWSQFFTACCIS